jgi:hypothetical protein
MTPRDVLWNFWVTELEPSTQVYPHAPNIDTELKPSTQVYAHAPNIVTSSYIE